MGQESRPVEPKVSAVDLDTIDLIETQKRIDKMVEYETRGFGDTLEALRRICDDYRLPYWPIRRLRERKSKTVNGGIIRRVRGAYLAYCEAQITKLQHEIAIERAKGTADDALESIAAEAAALEAKIKARKGQA